MHAIRFAHFYHPFYDSAEKKKKSLFNKRPKIFHLEVPPELEAIYVL